MIDAAAHFSHSYGEARSRFLDAASSRRLAVSALAHPTARGPDGDEIAIDAASDGDPAAQALLVVSSGTHGVEGFAGSGIQCALLSDAPLRALIDGARIRIVLLHALNPWGFAHDARGDENNVDLNRNFIDFDRGPVPNPLYSALHGLLLPPCWPPRIANEARLALAVLRHGRKAIKDALSRGQSSHPDGLFFAGNAPSWSHRSLRALMHRHAAGTDRIAWIDLHSGLGRRDRVEAIFNGCNDPAALARVRRWWGPAVTSMYDGSSVSSNVAGANFAALDDAGAAETASITLEAGTHPPRTVLYALRARQWLAAHPHARASLRHAILARSRATFCIDDAGWQRGVYAAARAAVLAAVQALAYRRSLP